MTLKHALLSLTIVVSVGGLFACNAKQDAAQTGGAAVSKTVTVSLPTMKCKICAGVITHAAKDVDGVTDCAVSVDNKTATVTYLSTKTDLPKIELAIAKSGYDANTTKRDPDAYNNLEECCK